MLYQLSYQANWELAVTLRVLYIPVEGYTNKYETISTGILRTHKKKQLPVGLEAQLVEHCTGMAEVMGSNPVRIFFFRL